MLDHLSRGRVWTVAGAGYRPEEFAMAERRPHAAPGKILEEHVEVLLRAFTGEPFEYQGREVVVTPKPFTDPHPTILIGGGVEAAARRAARLRLPMMPMHADPRLAEWYADESAKVGFEGGYVMRPSGPTFVHVTRDPDAHLGADRPVRAVRGADLRRRSRPAVSTPTPDGARRRRSRT